MEIPGRVLTTPRQRVAAQLSGAVLRVERHLGRCVSRAALAKRVNVSQASLYAYLNGSTLPRSAVFERLLDELGVTGAERGWLATLRDDAEIAQRVTRRVPRQLPPDAPHFVHRGAELSRLWEIATRVGRRVCVIDGMPGVGKSALAARFGHRVGELFPDGHLHADLSVTPTPSFDAALGGRYRDVLAVRRVLVVLDDATSADQVRPFVPTGRGSLLIVTSRHRMDSLVARDDAARVALEPLDPAATVDALAARVGPARASIALADRCAGLPLAVSAIAARAAADPNALTDLATCRNLLDALSSPDPDVDLRTAFRRSYDRLSPRAADLLRSPDPTGPDAAVRELLSANLLTRDRDGRLTVHPLLRRYAEERA